MKACTLLPMVSLILLWPAVPIAQDPVQVDPTHYKAVLDNPAVRVLRGFLPAGAKSPMHQHPDSIVIALQEIRARFTLPDGTTQDQKLAPETAVFTPAGTHSTTNTGRAGLNALIVEFKPPKPGRATLPPTRIGLDMKVLAESPRALVYRTTVAADFHEEPGTNTSSTSWSSASAPRSSRCISKANRRERHGVEGTWCSSVEAWRTSRGTRAVSRRTSSSSRSGEYSFAYSSFWLSLQDVHLSNLLGAEFRL